jgi:hypothetical protein
MVPGKSLWIAAVGLLLVAHLAPVQGKHLTCFDSSKSLCWWSKLEDNGNVTFGAVCNPLKGGGQGTPPGWCAFGLTVEGGFPPGSMGVAEVFWLSQLSTGELSFEDRVNLGGHYPPTCLVAQLSLVTSFTVEKDGSFHATWTRVASPNLKYYLDIAPGTTVTSIAAWGNSTGAQGERCGLAGSGGWSQHVLTGTMNVTF